LQQSDFTQERIIDLVAMGFADHQIKIAISYFTMEHTLTNMIEVCHKITLRKSKCGIFSRNALHHLKTLINYIESFNSKVNSSTLNQ